MTEDFTGTCLLCHRTLSSRGMARHLETCRERTAATRGPGGPKAQPTFRLAVRCGPAYWLHLELRQDATFGDLDDFFRRFWLECCGHMSAFRIGNVSVQAQEPEWGPEGSHAALGTPLGKLLSKGRRFDYEYDFGTTTHLTLQVGSTGSAPLKRSEVSVQARNDPPPVQCEECDAPATVICTECIRGDGGTLCAAHAVAHACGEEMLLPIVNSPRTGLCGYTGPA